MSNKTVIVVLTVAALLTGFIFFFERNTLSTSERQERKNRVFTEYKEDRVETLTLKHISGSDVALERQVTPGDPDGRWSLTSPLKADADPVAVNALLSALDYLLADRAVPGENRKDSRFGLDAPRIEGSFKMMGKTTTFEIGADAEGDKVYLHTSQDNDVIYAVNADILEALDKSANDLRSKQLVSAPVTQANRVSLKRPIGALEFTKQGTQWQVRAGETAVLADRDQVRELLAAVGDLKAESFVADNVVKEKLSQYGLASPTMEISVTPAEGEPVTVRLGGPCKDAPALTYATVVSSGTVACVGGDLRSASERPLHRFQETRLAPINVEDITGIRIEREGKTLALTRTDSTWSAADKKLSVDQETVNRMLTALTETRANQLDTGADATAALKTPKATVTLSAGETGEFALEMYGDEDGGVLVRRKDEPALLHMAADTAKWWDPSPLGFRNRIVVIGDAADIDRITVKGEVPQTLEKQGDLWHLTAPVDAPADATAVRMLTGPLAEIHVERFVAEKAEKFHGFDRPFATITARFAAHEHHGDTDAGETEKTVVLELGASTEGGLRYARLLGADETVFLVGDTYETALRNPPVARDLIQIDDTVVRKISFKTARDERAFTKGDRDKWTDDASGEAAPEALQKIVADLAGTKAINAVSFSDKDAALNNPLLTITASGEIANGEGDAKKTLTVGAKSPDETADAYTVRTADLPVTFLLPARVVDDILAFMGEREPADRAGTN